MPLVFKTNTKKIGQYNWGGGIKPISHISYYSDKTPIIYMQYRGELDVEKMLR